MNAKGSLGLNRLAFPFASALSIAILVDLHLQGYDPLDLAIYAALFGIILFEYRR